MKTTPRPLDSQIHLYGLILPQSPSELAQLGNCLAPGETKRVGLLKSEQAIKRYISGRGVLREILGGYLGIEAKAVQLAVGEHGKPFLLDNQENLFFNLAHSDDHFLLAITTDREVGIDLEMIVSDRPLEDMARMVFSRQEQDQWLRLTSPHRETAFYRCWVRKEACLKACGRGFSLPGNSFDVSSHKEQTAVMTVCCDQKHWHVLDLDMPPHYCAALAVESCGSTQSSPSVVRINHHLSFN